MQCVTYVWSVCRIDDFCVMLSYVCVTSLSTMFHGCSFMVVSFLVEKTRVHRKNRNNWNKLYFVTLYRVLPYHRRHWLYVDMWIHKYNGNCIHDCLSIESVARDQYQKFLFFVGFTRDNWCSFSPLVYSMKQLRTSPS